MASSLLDPIGVLSSWVLTEEDSDDLLRRVDPSLRADDQLISYLRDGGVVFAIMEQTWDVVGGSFGCPGGSGTQTDGRFFWRGDAADYVQAYGVRPSDEFLRHVAEEGTPRRIDGDELITIDSELWALRTSEQGPPNLTSVRFVERQRS